MEIYVIVSRAMNSLQAFAAFSTKSKAENFIQKLDEDKITIESWDIRGDYEFPDALYIANQYDPIADAPHSEGIYANYNDAKKSAGERGHVFTVIPDSR